MNVSATIRERRTIRKFKSTPVAQERIISLLNEAAGLYEAEGTPRWRCIYYDSLESRQRLAGSMIAKIKESRFGKFIPDRMTDFYSKQATEIPAHLAFIAESANTRLQSDENYAAVCSIMQNFQLLGWEHGLGMLWYTDPLIMSETFFKEIGLQNGERFAGVLSIGYFEKVPRARKRTPAEQKWTVIGGDDHPHPHTYADNLPNSPQTILGMLNEAVYAPNDGMREPWRFVYVTGGEAAGQLRSLQGSSSTAFLLVVAKEESDSHKQHEDYAAVCCLIQNFQLLPKTSHLHVYRTIPEWTYHREQCTTFGIRPQERIAAVLELGADIRRPSSASTPPTVNVVQR
jgi:nitroreductase